MLCHTPKLLNLCSQPQYTQLESWVIGWLIAHWFFFLILVLLKYRILASNSEQGTSKASSLSNVGWSHSSSALISKQFKDSSLLSWIFVTQLMKSLLLSYQLPTLILSVSMLSCVWEEIMCMRHETKHYDEKGSHCQTQLLTSSAESHPLPCHTHPWQETQEYCMGVDSLTGLQTLSEFWLQHALYEQDTWGVSWRC